jgi:alkaline phosphatase D
MIMKDLGMRLNKLFSQYLPLLLLLSLACQRPADGGKSRKEAPLSTIAFGSCNRQNLPQPLWTEILSQRPQLWVWLGDNIYGDSEDMAVLEEKYQQQKQQPAYARLAETTRVIGVWDDHDYGVNDGGKEYPKRVESQRLFWDFIGEPSNSPRRQQQGVYSAHTFGPAGKQVKVILLDSRYHRDSLHQAVLNGVKTNLPNETGDLLGEEQWQWLERELRNSPAQLHLIGNGIQVLPEDHRFEKWANFPTSRQRLLDLIASTQAKGVILLSGDRHIAEVSRMQHPGIPYPLFEITSSGLTHTQKAPATPEVNRHRVGEVVFQLHYGLLSIDWNGSQPQVQVKIKGEGDATFLEQFITF